MGTHPRTGIFPRQRNRRNRRCHLPPFPSRLPCLGLEPAPCLGAHGGTHSRASAFPRHRIRGNRRDRRRHLARSSSPSP
uniref:Uncharacterized protein n=1 Tax=Triticum urartu TaxID=4572 RepID=A0A8R7PU30_TRIUA